ncbi:unnamed protein product [Angiostrongylus costaricensis]|uniref:C2H2-type domain-containing protein n=1 Tax=Angiostrongylus costaricensis TaxID=334426 RepID=A0A0R3PJJ2_ANGCS|nr:unnamed protein product [Angiostrongylus costaricensis]
MGKTRASMSSSSGLKKENYNGIGDCCFVVFKGALQANGGTLPCFKCNKSFTTTFSLIAHIRRCRKPIANCPTFTDYKKAIAHLDSCIRPMYFAYLEGRADEFRLLDKKTKARYVREGMATNLQLPCLECGRSFTHQYGLIYHIERCNVDDELAKDFSAEEALHAILGPYRSISLRLKTCVGIFDFSSVLPFTLKESVGFRIFESKKQDNEKNVPTSCRRLQALNTVELENGDEYVTIAYCGGPINAIRVAPNSMPSEPEFLSLNLFRKKDERCLKPCDTFWHFKAQRESGCMTTFLSDALTFRLDTTSVPSPSLHSQNFPIVEPNPAIILEQEKFFDKPSDANSYSFAPPIHTMAWSARTNAQHIVGVNAAGAAVIWDLQRSSDAPHVLLDPAWSSPATSAAFINTFEGNVALSFRERMVRVYNIRTYECSLEENTVRTAGSRVSSQPRLLPGFFAFQAEYFSSGTVPSNGVCFICTEAKSDGYFVLPLANKHELMTWDVTTSPTNAVVASCGVDGRLLLSANGRLATFGSSMDFAFSVLKSALAITRRRVSDPESQRLGNLKNSSETAEGKEPHPQACPSYTTHEDTLQHLWLDISLKPETQTRRTRLDYSALDLRIESLNCVATNNLLRYSCGFSFYCS